MKTFVFCYAAPEDEEAGYQAVVLGENLSDAFEKAVMEALYVPHSIYRVLEINPDGDSFEWSLSPNHEPGPDTTRMELTAGELIDIDDWYPDNFEEELGDRFNYETPNTFNFWRCNLEIIK